MTGEAAAAQIEDGLPAEDMAEEAPAEEVPAVEGAHAAEEVPAEGAPAEEVPAEEGGAGLSPEQVQAAVAEATAAVDALRDAHLAEPHAHAEGAAPEAEPTREEVSAAIETALQQHVAAEAEAQAAAGEEGAAGAEGGAVAATPTRAYAPKTPAALAAWDAIATDPALQASNAPAAPPAAAPPPCPFSPPPLQDAYAAAAALCADVENPGWAMIDGPSSPESEAAFFAAVYGAGLRSLAGIEEQLLRASGGPAGPLAYVAERMGGPGARLDAKMDHLVCFLPGVFALASAMQPQGGAQEGGAAPPHKGLREHFLGIAERLLDT